MIELASLPAPIRLKVESELARLNQIIKVQSEEIRLLNIRRWGPKADKLSENQLALLPQETCVLALEIEQEAALPDKQKALPAVPKGPQSPRNHPGRTVLPAHLPRREEIIPCGERDCRCPQCGQARPVIGYEVREELDCKPAEFFVRVIKREKRGSHCLEAHGVVVAPVPAQIVPKSKLSDRFILEVLATKFQQHTPIYRQCAVLWEDHGIDLSRQTLNEAILTAAQWLIPVTQAMAAELLEGTYLQVDQTPVPCQESDKSGKNHTAYLWQFGVPAGTVVFDFQMGRAREGPKAFLKGFAGKLQCDGYGVYDHLGEDIIYVACMAHMRRKFVEASKLKPLDPLPVEIVGQIALLYQVEELARQQRMPPESRLALRQQKSKSLMEALKKRIIEIRQTLTPSSTLAKACDYALGQWSRMEQYLNDGRVEIDNNWCEGAMRPIALGRRNWLHVGDKSAGPKLAAIISIVETCRRLDIPLRPYLADVCPKLAACTSDSLAQLTPSAWKASLKS